MKKVTELMNAAPVSCTKDENLKNVANQMSKSNIGFMPVVDESKKVIGTITDRDVALSLAKNDKTPEKIRVQDVMNQDAHTVSPEDDASRALEIMRTKQVGRLPVVDKDRRLKGVVSLMGITRRIRNANEKTEIEHQGKENIINTARAIAERNHSNVGEFSGK